MNFDVNAIASLMQAMQNPPANDVKRDIPQSAPKNERVSDVSPFCAQNGLGEQIRINTDESGGEQKNAFADIMVNLAKQNPMFSLVSAMQGGKGDMSSLLPLIMSLMQSKKPKNEEKMYFEITEDGQVVKCNMLDEAYEVPNTGLSNINYELIGSIVLIVSGLGLFLYGTKKRK